MKANVMEQACCNACVSIYQAENGNKYVVKSAPELGILKSLGITKDAKIYKKLTHHLGGPVLLMVETCEVAIGKDIAKDIIVGEA